MPDPTRPPSPTPVTVLLKAWSDGDQSALEALLPLVEQELRRLARHYMRGERPGHTLQPTALVNEAYLRLVDIAHVRWQNRAHFMAVAARTMRRILVDMARAKGYQKRGGRVPLVPLDEVDVAAAPPDADVVALHDALESLAGVDARKARVVELRYFGGLGIDETAEALGCSPATVKRHWQAARAWLYDALSPG